jgi:NAD(P)-dependent dehydrogenase (short-subunit alcohol dehydrogenase family)
MTTTWLITGSSRGFGREFATAALDKGHQVVATARHPEQLDDLVQKYGDRARTFALDVTDADAARAAVRFTVEEFGRLDVVVNNAGHANSSAIEETPDEEFRAQVETNFFGVVNVTKAALPVLRAQRSGHFVQFSALGGRVGGSPGIAAYEAAKFAVEGFSEVLNAEVKPLGIRVTIIEPGAFRTDWAGSSMHIAPVGADYEETVGATNRRWADYAASAPGDPARAAQIIVDLVDLDEEPPLRLLLGSDAVELADESSRARAAEAAQWADVSRSTDFPPASDG